MKSYRPLLLPLMTILFSVLNSPFLFGSNSKNPLLSDEKSVLHYNLNSQLQWDWAISSLNNHPVQNTTAILDIGSGDGKITAIVAKQAPQAKVVGLDISLEMQKFASSHFTQEDYPNLSFIHGDVLSLPFQQEFDYVISFSCLHWVKDQLGALKRIYQSLTSGGKILVVLPGYSATTLKALSDQVKQSPKWKAHFSNFQQSRWFFDTSEYQELLKQAGFSHIEVKLSDSETRLSSIKVLKDWLRPVSPTVQFLPEDLQTTFLDDLIDLYLKHYPVNPNGSVSLHWPKLEAFAVK